MAVQRLLGLVRDAIEIGWLALALSLPLLGLAMLLAWRLSAARGVRAPRPIELASLVLLPSGLLAWVASQHGPFGHDDHWPQVVVMVAAALQFALATLIWGRHRRLRPVGSAIAVALAAYFTGGAVLVSLLDLYGECF